jgi:hypothetical protein
MTAAPKIVPTPVERARVTPAPDRPDSVTVKLASLKRFAFGQMGTLTVLDEVPAANVSVPVVFPP